MSFCTPLLGLSFNIKYWNTMSGQQPHANPGAQFDHSRRCMISSLMQLFGTGSGRGPWPCWKMWLTWVFPWIWWSTGAWCKTSRTSTPARMLPSASLRKSLPQSNCQRRPGRSGKGGWPKSRIPPDMPIPVALDQLGWWLLRQPWWTTCLYRPLPLPFLPIGWMESGHVTQQRCGNSAKRYFFQPRARLHGWNYQVPK